MIKRILVVGGANGIGLAIAQEMANRQAVEKVYVVDKAELASEYKHAKIELDVRGLLLLRPFYRHRRTDDNGGLWPVELIS